MSVDLSRSYLEVLERNLDRNGLGAGRHETIKLDAERYLERLPASERFDGIVLDPPTAAQVGRGFWSVRKKQAALVNVCLRQLNRGGVLLACRNDHGSSKSLYELVSAEAGRADVRTKRIEAAPPGPDFPRLDGFREGDAFEGVWAVRA